MPRKQVFARLPGLTVSCCLSNAGGLATSVNVCSAGGPTYHFNTTYVLYKFINKFLTPRPAGGLATSVNVCSAGGSIECSSLMAVLSGLGAAYTVPYILKHLGEWLATGWAVGCCTAGCQGPWGVWVAGGVAVLFSVAASVTMKNVGRLDRWVGDGWAVRAPRSWLCCPAWAPPTPCRTFSSTWVGGWAVCGLSLYDRGSGRRADWREAMAVLSGLGAANTVPYILKHLGGWLVAGWVGGCTTGALGRRVRGDWRQGWPCCSAWPHQSPCRTSADWIGGLETGGRFVLLAHGCAVRPGRRLHRAVHCQAPGWVVGRRTTGPWGGGCRGAGERGGYAVRPGRLCTLPYIINHLGG